MIVRIARAVIPALLLSGLVTVLTGCGTTRPHPRRPEPAPAPIVVDGAALPVVAFPEARIDIPVQRAIGYHYLGPERIRDHEYRWGPSFRDETDELNDLGQEILAEAGYRTATARPGALRLIGTVGGFHYDSYAGKGNFEQAELEVVWDLLGPDGDKPVFTTRTGGSGRIAAGESGAILAAFELALRRLLAREEFVQAVRAAGTN
jgi:hypothetical protein